MKRTIAIILAAMMLLSTAIYGQKTTAAADAAEITATEDITIADSEADEIESIIVTLPGGWSRAESPVIVEELKELIEKAAAKKMGMKYIPVAFLGRQIVAGTNYTVLCRIAPVVPNAVETYAVVYIYANLQGDAEITEVQELDVETQINDLPGGWSQAETPEITEDLQETFDAALAGLLGVNHTPIALLSTQVVRGTNYCFLCESTVVHPGAETPYTLVYIHADLDGSASLTEIQELMQK